MLCGNDAAHNVPGNIGHDVALRRGKNHAAAGAQQRYILHDDLAADAHPLRQL